MKNKNKLNSFNVIIYKHIHLNINKLVDLYIIFFLHMNTMYA